MILLGVGTAVPDVDRENTHMVWDGPGGPLLIDAGGSTYQRLLQAGIEPINLQGVLLTHSHADHINGLPVLLFSLSLVGRKEPLLIYGLEPTLNLVRGMLDAFHLEEQMAPVTWQSIAAGDTIPLAAAQEKPGETWMLRTAPTQHPRPCVALRFEERSSGKALTYSCDTAPCQSVAELAQGSQVLIHEASLAEPSQVHTTPRQAGEIAQQAGAQRLVIVHYSPRWTMSEEQALAEIRASGFGGTAEIGQENQVLALDDA
jgi:ribonuclease Z